MKSEIEIPENIDIFLPKHTVSHHRNLQYSELRIFTRILGLETIIYNFTNNIFIL
jgi:hypothetical protein